MTDETRRELDAEYKTYWKKNLALIRNLLIIWALVSLVGAIIFGNVFYNVSFFGVPFSFWLGHQGSILVFIVLIFYYAAKMDRLDQDVVKKMNAVNGKSRGVSA
ncbi:hypothetical protein SY88_10790 [Clostridiales bacterium PH28_bin88]|nr:hypothetical protein SY88_10790 [Clostridiales bacterium PH28_bin88]